MGAKTKLYGHDACSVISRQVGLARWCRHRDGQSLCWSSSAKSLITHVTDRQHKTCCRHIKHLQNSPAPHCMVLPPDKFNNMIQMPLLMYPKSFIMICATIFTARRVCVARTMLWQDVCPSVCHAPVFCLNC